jgi:hypothetical protein
VYQLPKKSAETRTRLGHAQPRRTVLVRSLGYLCPITAQGLDLQLGMELDDYLLQEEIKHPWMIRPQQ